MKMISIQWCLCICLAVFLQGSQSAPTSDEVDPNIVGGFIAKPGQFPFQISLREETSAGGHFCGGSIVDKNHVITAGHCCYFMESPYSNYYIAAGATNLSDSKNVLIPVKSIQLNEKFDYETIEYDICILTLSKSLKFSKYIKPIKITHKKVKPGTKCTISGWGVWSEQSYELHDQQKGANVPIVDSKTCVKDYSSEEIHVDPKTMVCAGYKNGGTDTCQGDSGGPLVCNKRLTGITSWGRGCAEAGYPGVYTNVVSFLQWLKKHGVKPIIDDSDDEDDVEEFYNDEE